MKPTFFVYASACALCVVTVWCVWDGWMLDRFRGRPQLDFFVKCECELNMQSVQPQRISAALMSHLRFLHYSSFHFVNIIRRRSF